MTQITLTAAHPYYPTLGDVTLAVPILDEPPGHAITNLVSVSVAELRRCDAWTPLTTEFLIVGTSAITERAALLSLLWDLTGQPLHPSGSRRPAGRFALVAIDARRVAVWRPTSELRFSADEKAIREREKRDYTPDVRQKEVA